MENRNFRPEGLKYGQWIGARMSMEDRRAPFFRKVVKIERPVRTARAYVCGLGYFEFKINGIVVDDSVLNPAHTQYTRTVMYREFDVISLLGKGSNVLTVELGNGFWNENGGVWKWQEARWRSIPKVLLNLEVCYEDGAMEIIATDTTWKVTCDGPTIANGIYQGESYDARKELVGVEKADYDDSAWENARNVAQPQGTLKLQHMPPIRRTAEFRPKSIERLADGTIIITTPEMVAGWAKIRLNMPEGTEAVIGYGEQLDDTRHLIRIGKGEGESGDWWKWYIQEDHFISAGKPFEFEPKFSYKGFKYIQIIGHDADISVDDVVIYRVCNDMEIVSDFHCSMDELNKLHELMRRTMLNNFQSKPTDTPVWEKNGWNGDANVALASMMYNFNMDNFLESFLNIMTDCFQDFNIVPSMVPTADWGTDNVPIWNSIYVFGAEAMYDRYGRLDFIRDNYDSLRTYALRQLEEISATDWIWGGHLTLSDWVSPAGEEDSAVFAGCAEGAELCTTAFLYKMMRSMEHMAGLLEKTEDAKEYADAAEQMYRAFNERFYNEEKGYYITEFWREEGKRTRYRQTCNLVPLAFDMVPDAYKERVAENLIADVVQRKHLDTGCVGTKFILPVLADLGRADLAQMILAQTTYPSWLYWLEHGSDTAWEAWEPSTRSKDHYFLGTYEEYFYSHLLGIRDLQDGCRTFTVAPEIHCGLEFVEGYLRTPYGEIRSAWRKDGNITDVTIEIPDGCMATIKLDGVIYNAVCGTNHYRI